MAQGFRLRENFAGQDGEVSRIDRKTVLPFRKKSRRMVDWMDSGNSGREGQERTKEELLESLRIF